MQATPSGYRVYLHTGPDHDAHLTIAEAEQLHQELGSVIADVKRSIAELKGGEHEAAQQAADLAEATNQKVKPNADVEGETLSDKAAAEAAGAEPEPEPKRTARKPARKKASA